MCRTGDRDPLTPMEELSSEEPSASHALIPECRHCGACCFSPSSAYVWVRGDDWARLGPDAERLATFIDNRAFMRMEKGHCAALAVRRAGGGGWDFFCTIYERRPQICRDLARGSAECASEREPKVQK
jgi:Fe-S-cluster containining protein